MIVILNECSVIMFSSFSWSWKNGRKREFFWLYRATFWAT